MIELINQHLLYLKHFICRLQFLTSDILTAIIEEIIIGVYFALGEPLFEEIGILLYQIIFDDSFIINLRGIELIQLFELVPMLNIHRIDL